MQPALRLVNGYGFTKAADEAAFVPTPDIVLQRSITGALAIDDRYRLDIQDSIVDAGRGVGDPPARHWRSPPRPIPPTAWGAPLDFHGLTCFGARAGQRGRRLGGIFTQRFEVLDNQHGCIKRAASAPPNRCRRTISASTRRTRGSRLRLRVVQRAGLWAARARRRPAHPHAGTGRRCDGRVRLSARRAQVDQSATCGSANSCQWACGRRRTGDVSAIGDNHARRLLGSELRPA